MSMDAVKAGATAPAKAKRDHEALLQRQALDWIEVATIPPGAILVMRVPNEKFIHPGTKREDVTEEQMATMQACHDVLGILIQSLGVAGVRVGGAAILAADMKLEDLPPPNAQKIHLPRPGIILPPGTKV